MAVRLSALSAGRALHSKISSSMLERLARLRKFNGHIGSRTCDLPARSIEPQPTTLPRAPFPLPDSFITKKINSFCKCNQLQQEWERTRMHIGYWWESQKERDQ
jgi:hypothetical protein